MLRILEEGKDRTRELKEMILQPQSEIPLVRRTLKSLGFEIRDEDMVEEDGKYYPMMRVRAAEQKKTAAGELQSREITDSQKEHILIEETFGPVLLKKRHPVLLEWIERERNICENILAKLPEKEEIRRREVKEKVGLLDRAVFQMNRNRKQ